MNDDGPRTEIECFGEKYHAFYRDGNTVVIDHAGNEAFFLPGQHEKQTVHRIIQIADAAYHRGHAAGRASLQAELRHLLDVPATPKDP